ncbi:MAG: tetratricopeptide repeat protein [Longimicrobiales bacterium]
MTAQLPIATIAIALSTAVQTHEKVPLYDGLGDHHHEISTHVPLAQTYFDQGLRLTYAFNHPEAIRSFEEAAKLDPSCGICWWGSAFAYGPNINAPMDEAAGVKAHEALSKALALMSGASEQEQAYIRALAKRYAATSAAQSPARDSAYARAMGELAKQYPDDDDALVLAADAVMNLSPWDYWLSKEQPKPLMAEAIRSLETVLARSPDHAGACHLFIHSVEEAQPDRAVACADRLGSLMPGAGHIAHMPGHIYIRVGRYGDAIDRNIHATHADSAILKDIVPDGMYRIGYVPHNYHFMWFAATLAGRTQLALKAAQQTAAIATPELVSIPAVQQFMIAPYFANVRFERWDEILAAGEPTIGVYPKGIHHFARTVALAAKGRPADAKRELVMLREVLKDPSLADAVVGFNSGQSVLMIADAFAEGEIAAREKRWDDAVRAFTRAAALEVEQTYGEPPDWHQPVRQTLGSVLLAAGKPAEAEKAFREDLDRFPENGWSLMGLARSLEAQNRTAEAAAAWDRFEKAFQDSDVARTLMVY